MRSAIQTRRCSAWCVFSLLLPMYGCHDSVAMAVEQIDKAEADLRQDSSKWSVILPELVDQFPKDLRTEVIDAARDAAKETIVEGGVQVRCTADFMANRSVDALERIKAILLKLPVPPRQPVLCTVVPDHIDLNETSPDVWANILFDGYDLDAKGADGKPLQFSFVTADQTIYDIDDACLARQTHYHVAVNASGNMPEEIFTSGATKLVAVWDGQAIDLKDVGPVVSEVPVNAFRPTNDSMPFTPGRASFSPPVNPGANQKCLDFNTDAGRPMTYSVWGETYLSDDGQKVLGKLHMRGDSHHGCMASADGISAPMDVFSAPPGTKIVSFTPKGRTEIPERGVGSCNGPHDDCIDTDNMPGGQSVSQFVAYLDHDGNDIGSFTRVDALWSLITIDLVRTQPKWLAQQAPNAPMCFVKRSVKGMVPAAPAPQLLKVRISFWKQVMMWLHLA